MISSERRAAALLRWYPRSWRERYGDEFAALLLAEFGEQPQNWRRTADVAVSGIVARCTNAGLTRNELAPPEQIRSGVATLCCALATFLTFGVAMLAQLATGWQWATPGSTSATGGSIAMAAAVACLALIGLLAGVPVVWRAAVTAVRYRDGKLARSSALVLVAGTAFVSGTLHVQNSWPGTGGTGALHGLVPGGIAAFGWASTLAVSTFWAHPALLAILPGTELAWMVVSPFALLGLVAGLVAVLRRLAMPGRLLTYLARLALAAGAVAAVFLVGAASWVFGNGPSQAELFRPGLINGAELAIMALALTVALRAGAGIWRALAAGTTRF